MRSLPTIDRSNAIATYQRKLVLHDKPAVVLATVEMARHLLVGHDEDDILALIQEHAFIPYAWNIALSESAAREIRIFPDCITWYSRTMGKGLYPLSESEVLDRLFTPMNGDKPFIRGNTLRLLFNCSATHLIHLVEAKLLAQQPGTSYYQGRNGSPVVTLPSVRQFLKSRRL